MGSDTGNLETDPMPLNAPHLMPRLLALAACLLFALLPETVNAAKAGEHGAGQVTVKSVRSYASAESTRVVFDLSGPVQHSIFVLRNPDRVVVDVHNAHAGKRFRNIKRSRMLSGMRHAPRKGRDLRMVLDLKQRAQPKTFLLSPGGNKGYRLVVDLKPGTRVATKGGASHATASNTSRSKSGRKAVKSVNAGPDGGKRKVVVAIDPGHGGIDPGAIGHGGLREKFVVLAIAKRLARLINAEPGMRAVLTRSDDRFLPLRTRIDKARRYKADLFISIHADGFHDSRARGSSVYVVSKRGASSEAARWLAHKENQADLVGGVSLDDKEGDLAKVLLDLSQNATIEASHTAADDVLRQLKAIGPVHKRRVERAAFVVLKSPDIPSMLVETAFISNPKEAKRLGSAKHQQRLARAILGGVKRYFRGHAPAGTWFASRKKVLASAR